MKILLILALLAVIIWWWPKHSSGTIKIGGTKIEIEKALTPIEKAQGLSGRDKLADNAGMLFVYSNQAKHAFWMQGMKFDLDFIFISGDTIVDIQANIPAPKNGSAPVTIIPKEPVDKILEVNAGFAAKHKIKIGDKVE
jgi:hypothetical protein